MVAPGSERLRQRVEPLLARIRLMTARDRAYTRAARWWLVGAVLSLVVGVGLTIVVNETRALRRRVDPSTVFFAFVPITVGVCGWQWRRYRRLDLDDRKLASVRRVLTLLRADIPLRDVVDLTADFRDCERGGQLVERSGSWIGSNIKKYRHGWLTVRARLADGNAVVIAVTDRAIRRQKRKSSGGKTKWKVVRRAYTDVDVSLRLAKPYRPATVITSQLRDPRPVGLTLQKLEPSVDGTWVHARFRSRTVQNLGELPGAEAPVAVLRWLYQGLAIAAQRPA